MAGLCLVAVSARAIRFFGWNSGLIFLPVHLFALSRDSGQKNVGQKNDFKGGLRNANAVRYEGSAARVACVGSQCVSWLGLLRVVD